MLNFNWNKIKLILILCGSFFIHAIHAQQGTGTFIAMDGGMEGQVVGQLPNTSSSSIPTNSWSRSVATGSVTIRQISGNGGRSGTNYLSINNTSTTGSTNVLSPSQNSGAIIGGSSYVIQFFYKATNGVNLPNAQIGVGASNAISTSTVNTNFVPNTTINNSVWLKSVTPITAANASIPGNGFSSFRIAAISNTNSAGIDIDDWVMYAGSTADITPPSIPGAVSINDPSASTLNVSWGASANIDGGGYLVVRYTINPVGQPDPNENGIYAIGNTIGSGVVVYTGLGTSFTNNLLSANTTYYYRVYTVDKAFNYSAFVSAVGNTNNTLASTNYYIDATNGNDFNDGNSPLNAWKSIAKVNAKTFEPGDSILFKCGEVWSGTILYPKGSGISKRPIVIAKYGIGNLPRIDGHALGSPNQNAVYLFNQRFWTISNIEVTNNYASTNTDTVLRRGIYVEARDFGVVRGITLKDLVVRDVLGTYDSNVESGGIFLAITGNNVITIFDSILIDNCKVYNVDRIGISNNSTWDGRDANGDFGSTPWRPSTNIIIQNCRVDSSGGNSLIIRDAQSPIIQNNIFWKSSKRYSGNSMFIFNCDDALVQYNEAAYNVYNPGDVDASGFDGDYRCKRTIFQYNYSHDNDGGAFVVVCQPGGVPGRFNDGTIIRYNISQNDGFFNGGLNNEGQIFSITGQSTNTTIYNNVVYSSNNFNYAITHRRWGDAGNVWPDNTRYFNNIFYFNKSNATFAFQSSTNNLFNNNVFYYAPPNTGINPIDGNVITSNPLFVNPGSGTVGLNSLNGYKLQINSPCINTGVLLQGHATKDFWGNTVPNAVGQNPDRGAFEFSTSLPATVVKFKGIINNNHNVLSWITVNEVNNTGFYLQKSIDGIVFIDFAFILTQTANGNSANTLTYKFTDKNVLNGANYYRLKQIDKDGKYNYSSIIVLRNTSANISSISIFPNPVVGHQLNIKSTDLPLGKYTVLVTNSLGKNVFSTEVVVSNNEQVLLLQLPQNIATGNYYLSLINTKNSFSSNFLLQ